MDEVLWVFVLVFAAAIMVALLRIAKPRRVVVFEYQRAAIFKRGKLEKIVGPGMYWVGLARSISPIDVRLQVLNVAGQEVLTAEGLSLKLSLAGEYKIEDIEQYLIVSSSPGVALYNYAQQALREALATHTFETILATRTTINARMLELLTPQTAKLGISLQKIEIRDIILPGDLKRAFAQSVTAQKEGLANLERARAETASLRSLANAAKLLQDHPGMLQLRAIQAIEASKGNTITLGLAESQEKI
jgi:regulator of protease activity HflC (stomatin/prohibitin superfamily)